MSCLLTRHINVNTCQVLCNDRKNKNIANLPADNMLINRFIRVSYINVIAEHAVQDKILKYVIYTCTNIHIETYI